VHAPVRMMDQLAVYPVPARPHCHFQRIERQAGPHVISDLPAHDHAGIQVDNESRIRKAAGRLDVGNVRHPAAVRRSGGEVPLQQVSGPLLPGRARDRGPRPLLPGRSARDAQLAHQPLHRAPGYLDAFPVQLPPHFPSPVNPPPFLFPHPHDLRLQFLIPRVPRRRLLLSFLRRVIRRRRYLQDRAGRLHPEPVPMLIDEPD
jgi:hypothetical protein